MIVGGGTGGCSVAAKFARDLNDKKKIIVLEPADKHFYQPLFTLIGGGIKKLSDAEKPTSQVLPKQATWIKDKAIEFIPQENIVKTTKGDTIKYDFLLIAIGLKPHYEKVKLYIISLLFLIMILFRFLVLLMH